MNILETSGPRISREQKLRSKTGLKALLDRFEPDLVAMVLRVDEHWYPSATQGFGEEILFTEPFIQATLVEAWNEKKSIVRLEPWIAKRQEHYSIQLSTIWSTMTVSSAENSEITFMAKKIKKGVYVQTDLEELEEMASSFNS